MSGRQRAFDLLFRHLFEHVLNQPGPPLRIGVFQAEAHAALHALSTHARVRELALHSQFKPQVNLLQQMGFQAQPQLSGELDLLLFVPSKQRRESLGALAQMSGLLAQQGQVLLCCAKDLGAASYEKNLRQLLGHVGVLSKSHCRLCWSISPCQPDAALQARWQAEAMPSQVPGTDFHSVPGIYGWNQMDAGSTLLAAHLPSDLSGSGINLGCNYGYLAQQTLSKNPNITTLHLVEADARALDCARSNLAAFAQVQLHFHWADVDEALPTSLDFAVLNPPFHSGKDTDYTLGQRFIRAAAACLRPGGRLYLVANQFLNYEDLLDSVLGSHQRLLKAEGFKLISGVK